MHLTSRVSSSGPCTSSHMTSWRTSGGHEDKGRAIERVAECTEDFEDGVNPTQA